ncbi:MAG: tetratricopeptide repeat protein, partial [Treponema sp.]|nr:tetratricopeptide repeat protein [Treponema sp.]
MKKFFLKTFVAFFLVSSLFAQETTSSAGMKVPSDRIRNSDEGFASEDFRRGVQSYYRGAFNEAIVQFEKALSYLPNDNLILDWLGK